MPGSRKAALDWDALQRGDSLSLLLRIIKIFKNTFWCRYIQVGTGTVPTQYGTYVVPVKGT